MIAREACLASIERAINTILNLCAEKTVIALLTTGAQDQKVGPCFR